MRRIDIDEPVQPTATALGHLLLRLLVGLVVIGHGYLKLLQPHGLQAQLTGFEIPNAETVVLTWIGLECLAGVCLVFGRFTRLGAFLALCDASAAIALMLWGRPLVAAWRPEFEPPVLLAAAALYFLCAGSGRFGADLILRKRARLKALIEDEIWQRPPYVAVSNARLDDGGAYGRPLKT